ncbi:unnamed protein product [Meganyctiphanes norvegica]|uniref:EF-hand domain-containing protein n=1 Tax=Meganyctiphanes norvegica TaxID=48144 RepID=A0AAV2RHT7_MEGNR
MSIYNRQQYVYQGQHQPPPTQAGGYAAQTHYGQQSTVNPSASGVDPNISSWFIAVDQDKTGQINAKELSQALYSGKQKFSEEACKLLITMFDKDYSGTINIYEFGELFKFVAQWTETYRRFDLDNSGTIDEEEYRQALLAQGYQLSPQFINVLATKFAPTTHQFTLDNFIVSNVRIHNLTQAFRSRDIEMKGMITIGYEEFLSVFINSCI